MGDFTAKLELPQFIPKEQILGKYVFDSGIVCMGVVEDWTYSSDGEIKMVVRMKNAKNKCSTVLIPFSYIERVGQFILLKTKREKFGEDSGNQAKKMKEGNKYFNEIDEKKLNNLIKK